MPSKKGGSAGAAVLDVHVSAARRSPKPACRGRALGLRLPSCGCGDIVQWTTSLPPSTRRAPPRASGGGGILTMSFPQHTAGDFWQTVVAGKDTVTCRYSPTSASPADGALSPSAHRNRMPRGTFVRQGEEGYAGEHGDPDAYAEDEEVRQGGGSEEGYDDNEDYDDGGDSGTDEQFVRDAHAADLGAPATYVYGQLPPQGGEDADMTLHIQMQPSQPQPQLPQLRIVMAGRSAESLYMSAQDAAEAVSLRSRPRKCAAAGRLSAVVNHPVRALAHHLKLPWTAMADESVVIGLCGELVPGSEAFMFAPCRPLYACAAMPLDVVHGACAPYLQRVMDAVAEADREAAAWLNNRLTSELHALGMDVFAQTQALLCSQHPDDVREQWRWLHSQAKAGDTCRERPASLKSVAGAGAGEDGSVADQTWTAVQKELYNRTRARERVQSREEMIEATLEFAFPVTAIMAHAIESAVARGLSAGQREAQSIAGLMQTDPALRYSVARAKLSAGYWNPNISTIVADLMLFTVLHQRSQFMDSLKAGKPRSACRTVVALSAIIDLPQPSCKWVERTRNELYPRIDVPDIVEILQQPSHSITPADVNAARRFSTMADTITEEMTLMRQLVGLPERWEDHRRAAFDVVTMGDAQVRQFAGGDPRKRLQLMACWRWAVAMRFVSMLRQVEAIVERKLGVAAEQMSVPQDMLHKLNLAQQPQATSAAANRLPAQ